MRAIENRRPDTSLARNHPGRTLVLRDHVATGSDDSNCFVKRQSATCSRSLTGLNFETPGRWPCPRSRSSALRIPLHRLRSGPAPGLLDVLPSSWTRSTPRPPQTLNVPGLRVDPRRIAIVVMRPDAAGVKAGADVIGVVVLDLPVVHLLPGPRRLHPRHRHQTTILRPQQVSHQQLPRRHPTPPTLHPERMLPRRPQNLTADLHFPQRRPPLEHRLHFLVRQRALTANALES
jgi:hypothetical protein